MWVFHLIQFLVCMLQTLTETSEKLAKIVHLQRSNLGLGLYRSMIWAVDSTRQSKHFSAAKTICQGSCVRTKVVIRSAEATCCSCPSSRLALLLIPHLTIHSQTHTSKDAATAHAFCSARSSGDTGALPFASSRLQMAASRSHGKSSLSAPQRQAILRHPALHPSAFKTSGLRWMRWGEERDTISEHCSDPYVFLKVSPVYSAYTSVDGIELASIFTPTHQ